MSPFLTSAVLTAASHLHGGANRVPTHDAPTFPPASPFPSTQLPPAALLSDCARISGGRQRFCSPSEDEQLPPRWKKAACCSTRLSHQFSHLRNSAATDSDPHRAAGLTYGLRSRVAIRGEKKDIKFQIFPGASLGIRTFPSPWVQHPEAEPEASRVSQPGSGHAHLDPPLWDRQHCRRFRTAAFG